MTDEKQDLYSHEINYTARRVEGIEVIVAPIVYSDLDGCITLDITVRMAGKTYRRRAFLSPDHAFSPLESFLNEAVSTTARAISLDIQEKLGCLPLIYYEDDFPEKPEKEEGGTRWLEYKRP